MKYIYVILIILLLNSCTTPTINQKRNCLSITYNSKILFQEQGTIIYNKRINLININIYQYIYCIADQYIIYEYVKAENSYKFTKGIKRSAGMIFDTNKYSLDYNKGNLYFFTLQKNSQSIYLILENINSSALKFLYGFSKNAYLKIMQAVKEDTTSTVQFISSDVISKLNINDNIKTNWNPKLIIIDQIVSKELGIGHFGRR